MIRRLPFGTGLIMLQAAPPIITNLQTWTERHDAKTLRANAELQASMRVVTLDGAAEKRISQAE